MEPYYYPNVDGLYHGSGNSWDHNVQDGYEWIGERGDKIMPTRPAQWNSFNPRSWNSKQYARLCGYDSNRIGAGFPGSSFPDGGHYKAIPIDNASAELRDHLPYDQGADTAAYWAGKQGCSHHNSQTPSRPRGQQWSTFQQGGLGLADLTSQEVYNLYYGPKSAGFKNYSTQSFFRGAVHGYQPDVRPGTSNWWQQYQNHSQRSFDYYTSLDYDPLPQVSKLPPDNKGCETIHEEDWENSRDVEDPSAETCHEVPPAQGAWPKSGSDDHQQPRCHSDLVASEDPVGGPAGHQSDFQGPKISKNASRFNEPSCAYQSNTSCRSARNIQHSYRQLKIRFKLKLRKLATLQSSLLQERRELEHERKFLSRWQRQLDVDWRELELAHSHRTRWKEPRNERAHPNYDFNANGTRYSQKSYHGRHNSRETPRFKPWRNHARPRFEGNSFEDFRNSCSWDDIPGQDDGQGRFQLPPCLSAAAVATAEKSFNAYDSAWISIDSSTGPASVELPYPTCTQRPHELLKYFPSNVRLPEDSSGHPSCHTRIEYHAMVFYLSLFGMRPTIQYQRYPSLPDQAQGSANWTLDVASIETVQADALRRLKKLIGKEIIRWHEDKLRRKGFGKVLDGAEAVLEIQEEGPQNNVQGDNLRRGSKTSGKKIRELEVVQGVWAAVQLLLERVQTEMNRRKEK